MSDSASKRTGLSAEHELIVDLFDEEPQLARLLSCAAIPNLDWHEEDVVRSGSIDFSQLRPTPYRADGVIIVGQRSKLGVIIEVQRSIDLRKKRTWPLYAHALHEKQNVPVILIVVATTSAVETWARGPCISGPTSSWSPIVIGPHSIGSHLSLETVDTLPSLGVLATILLGEATPEELVRRTVEHVGPGSQLARRLSTIYYDIMVQKNSAAASFALEAIMGFENYQYQSDFARKYFGEGIEKGLSEGIEKGLSEGIEKGRLFASKRNLRMVLQQQGFTVSNRHKKRIEACADPAVLERWIMQSFRAENTDDALS